MKKTPTLKNCNFCETAPVLQKYANMFKYVCPHCFTRTPEFKSKVKARGYWNKFYKVLKTP